VTNSHRMDRGNEEKGARGASKKTRGLVVVGDTRDVDFVGGKKKRFFLFSFFQQRPYLAYPSGSDVIAADATREAAWTVFWVVERGGS